MLLRLPRFVSHPVTWFVFFMVLLASTSRHPVPLLSQAAHSTVLISSISRLRTRYLIRWQFTTCSLLTSEQNFESLSNIDASLLNEGTFAVEFTDFNDAKQAAMLTLQFLFRDQPVKVFKLTPKDLAVKRGKREELVSNWQATYSVGVVCLDRGTGAMSTQELFETCQSVGAVKAFARIDAQQANPQIIAVFRVEWSDTKAQMGALNGAPFMVFLETDVTKDLLTYIADLSTCRPAVHSRRYVCCPETLQRQSIPPSQGHATSW